MYPHKSKRKKEEIKIQILKKMKKRYHVFGHNSYVRTNFVLLLLCIILCMPCNIVL